MEVGTTGGELIEVERNSDSDDGQAVYIQELTLDMKTTEEGPNISSLQNPSIPPDMQAEAVRISFHERKLSFSKQKHKFEEIDVLNKDGSDTDNQTRRKIELVQDKD